MHRSVVVAGIAAALLPATFANVLAADAPGCKDPYGLKRFEASAIVACEKRDFAEYTVPTGKLQKYDFGTKKGSFDGAIDAEGKLAQNVYMVPKGPSSAEVFRNYKNELAEKGFRILYEGKQGELGGNLAHYFENMGPGGQVFGYSPDEARFLTAVREEGNAKQYLVLYTVEFADGYAPKYQPQKGQVMVRLDTLQIGELTDRMVLVTAEEIDKGINSSGHVAFYGIQFDYDKTEIKPESRPAIDEIAKYLKMRPGQKVMLVGHTDNAGDFNYNMNLSKSRASSIANDLVSRYGIQPGRLVVAGAGATAPVASNASDDGRAKNRRVELVAQ